MEHLAETVPPFLGSVSPHLSAAVRKHCRNAAQACQTMLSVLAAYLFLFLLCTPHYNLAVSSLCLASREDLYPRFESPGSISFSAKFP